MQSTDNHEVVGREEWIARRTAFLKKEKEFFRVRDQLNQERRELPWERVENYTFDGPEGPVTLSDLFGKNSQLIVYHLMFAPEWEEPCEHCSFWIDHFDATLPHLNARDASLVAISRAPVAKIEAFKKRMGWKLPWVSSGNNSFNYDQLASFTNDEVAAKRGFFNYEWTDPQTTDRESASVFFKDPSGAIFHTYSTYGRGIDMLNGTYHLLDICPKGRDEQDLPYPQAWVKFKDEYPTGSTGYAAQPKEFSATGE